MEPRWPRGRGGQRERPIFSLPAVIRLRRAIAAIGALVLTLGGCAGSDAGDTTSTIAAPTTTAPTTTSTTMPSTTTTPPIDTEMPAAPGRLIMRPDTTYAASRFWTPFSLTPEDEGWWVRGLEETWGYLEYYGPRGLDQSRPDLGRVLDLSFVAHSVEADPESILTGFLARDHIEVVNDPVMTTVAGRDAWAVDVVNTDEGRAATGFACDDGGPHSAYWDPAPGVSMHTVVDPRDGSTAHLGLASCRSARIWAVDVDGETIVIIAATTNEEFDELIPVAGRLLTGIEFDS